MKQIMEDVAHITSNIDLSPLRGSRVLVTGGTGLLGRYLVYSLLSVRDIDLSVHVMRDDPTFQKVKNIDLYYGNLANESSVMDLPEADFVICAHSYAQPLRFMAEPLTALRGSSYGLLGLLEKCAVGGRFLYLSSSELYIDCPATPPFHEDDVGMISPYHPRACYIVGKMFGEAITYLYRQRGINTVSVRPGITFGPGFRRDDRRSWCSFIQRAVDEKHLQLLDGGLVKRTFCYISDGIEMLFRILINGRQEVYNLAGETSVSIREMAKIIGDYVGITTEIPSEKNGVAGTPDNLAMSMDRYNAEFGKYPYLDIKTGFERTIDWYRDA